MKMELIKEYLEKWGEVIIRTSSGQVFELHIGDTSFDKENRVIKFTSADSKYVMDGDSIEVVQMHASHEAR